MYLLGCFLLDIGCSLTLSFLCLRQIWNFTMKSACCKHEIAIQTDPKNCEYVIVKGARRKIEEYDAEDAETLELPADEGWQFFFPHILYVWSFSYCMFI